MWGAWRQSGPEIATTHAHAVRPRRLTVGWLTLGSRRLQPALPWLSDRPRLTLYDVWCAMHPCSAR
jgi:hypothetical protein